MKVKFVYKGGKGSGHFDHDGRPGKVGGSLPDGQTLFVDKAKVTSAEAILKVMQDIKSNERMWNLVIASEADGDLPAGENFYFVEGIAGADKVLVELDEDSALGEYEIQDKKVYTEIYNLMNEIYEAGKIATEENGWLDPNDDGSGAKRKEWEEKYYGKVVGGHSKGLEYAASEIEQYVKSKLGNVKFSQPKKTKVKLTDPGDIFLAKYELGKPVVYNSEKWYVVSHLNYHDKHAVVLRKDNNDRIVTVDNDVIDIPEGKRYWEYI